MTKQAFDWRKHLPVHEAAELFPLLPEAELKELAADIQANGLRTQIVTYSGTDDAGGCLHSPILLDGRNRLDALALLGLLYETGDHHLGLKRWTDNKGWIDRSGDRIDAHAQYLFGGDPYALVLSYNVHRRHLNAEQRRDLIAKLLKAQPEKSDRAIAKQAKADKNTVAAVRAKKEARGEIHHVEKRTDTKGRKQPAKKQRKSVEERDRAECIALNQKVIAAEQELLAKCSAPDVDASADARKAAYAAEVADEIMTDLISEAAAKAAAEPAPALDGARAAFVAVAKTLTKSERLDEMHKLVDLLDLRITDFVMTMTIARDPVAAVKAAKHERATKAGAIRLKRARR
jgi:hypothetical protein